MKSRISYFLLLTVGIYLVVSLSRSIYSLSGKNDNIDEAKSRVEAELNKNTALNRALAEVQTRMVIERDARDKLNMSKTNETVVVIPKDLVDKIASETATVSASFFNRPEIIPNWKKWWKMFF